MRYSVLEQSKNQDNKPEVSEESEKLKELVSVSQERDTLKKRMQALLHEYEGLKEDLLSDSEYIAQLQSDLAEAKKSQRNTSEENEQVNLIQEEKEELQKKLSEVHLHAGQLEKAVQYLRSKLEEANTDKELLGEELHEMQEKLEVINQEQKDIRLNSSEFEKLKSEKTELSKELGEREKNLFALEKEVEALKETIVLSIQEAKGFAEQCSQLANQQQHSEQEEHKLKQQLESQAKKVTDLECQITQAKCNEVSVQEAEEKVSQLEKEIIEKERLHKEELTKGTIELESKIKFLEEQIREKDESINSHQRKQIQHDEEKRELTKTIDTLRIQLKDKESETKVAQQHLAKKVKEYTLLNNRYEEQKKTHTEIQGRLNTAQSKVAELGNALHAKQDLEQRLEARLSETIKTSETQARRWEEQINRHKFRVQELEKEAQELYQVKEKFRKMESLFSDKTMAVESKPAPLPIEPPRSPEPLPSPPSPKDLFAPPPSHHPYKNNLFEG